jgi:cytidyltransferase-like protein
MELFVNNGQRESNSAAPSAMLRISIVSGYFNPLHVGHIRMMEAAAEMADRLIVIVNNDEQQMMKKGRIITSLDDRLEVVRALRIVDEAVPAVDEDATVKQTLASIRERYPAASVTFANGGDRSTTSVVAAPRRPTPARGSTPRSASSRGRSGAEQGGRAPSLPGIARRREEPQNVTKLRLHDISCGSR